MRSYHRASRIILLFAFSLSGCKNKATAPSQVEEKKFREARQSNADWQEIAKKFDKNKAEAMRLFAGADKVEIFRVAPSGKEKALGSIHNLSYFAVGKTQGADFAARLGALLFNAKNYGRPGDAIKSCYLEPAVVFRVWNQKRRMDAVLCFQCSELALFEYDTKAPQRSLGGDLSGKYYVAGDFDSVRTQYLALTKEALPNDPIFAKL